MQEDQLLIPGDRVTSGELQIREPRVRSDYFAGAGAEAMTVDGWSRTGDIVTLDSRLSIQLADRAKDLIKSSGEWISSIKLENALMAHPAIAEAAVVPMADARRGSQHIDSAATAQQAGHRADGDVVQPREDWV